MNYVQKFINKARLIHDYKYDYSKVIECDSKTPVEIICPVHGSFFQRKDVHVKGGGCKKCIYESMPAKRDLDSLVAKFNEIHNYKYDYSKVTGTKSKDRILISCPDHGDFEQTVAHHIVSRGCPKCSFDKQRLKHEDFIEKSMLIHGGKYDYSLVNLTEGFNEKVVIICPAHGEFSQSAGPHMLGNGCVKCGHEKARMSRYQEYTTEYFVNRSTEIHGDRYSYESAVYVNTETKIKITCKEHGIFEQRPLCHIRGKGCVKCRNENTTYNFIQKYRHNPDLGSEKGIIYVLSVEGKDEKFLKFGITSNYRGRLKKYRMDFKKVGYSYEVLYKFETTNYISAMVENDILKELRRESAMYLPKLNFSGKSECIQTSFLDYLLDRIPITAENYYE